MCLFCGTKPFSLSRMPTRRSFVAGALSIGRLLAGAKAIGPVAAAAQNATADTIIENAKIITLDPKLPNAEAIAIARDTIIGVGSRREIERVRGPSTRIIDAEKRTLVRGLNDAHTHFIRGGLTYSQEVRWDGVPSLALALQMLKEQAGRTPAPHWVQVVGGWTPHQFKEKRLPTLEEINAAAGDVPCFVMHLYDRAFINKAGLRALGFSRDTADPMGGLIARRRRQSHRARDRHHQPGQPVERVRAGAQAVAGRSGRLHASHDARAQPARRHEPDRCRGRRAELS
jgi:hypothetical protein